MNVQVKNWKKFIVVESFDKTNYIFEIDNRSLEKENKNVSYL